MVIGIIYPRLFEGVITLSKENTIMFSVLGEFAWREGTAQEWTRNNGELNGKKLGEFITYLILSHKRELPTSELISIFWSDGGSNPANSLKNYVLKTRNLLKTMFPERDDLLVSKRGRYAWNSEINIELDTERFSALCNETPGMPELQRLNNLMDAIRLYAGDLLPGLEADWAQAMRTYYHALFVDACREALELLKVRERWNDVAFVSSSAYAIDQDTEEFSLSFMLAMIKLGQPARAIDHYDTYKQMLWNVYGLTPGKEMEDLYRQAEEASNIPALSSDEIVQLILHEDEYERKAMLCSFTVFRKVTSLETRICQRDGIASSIAILSTGVADKLPPTTDIKRLERVLRDGLRASDSFARLNAATYVVLLSGANEENGMRVMERLDRQLHKLYPRSLMRMQYQVIQLTAQLPPRV